MTPITIAELEQAANFGLGMPLPTGSAAEELRLATSASATACAAAVGVCERSWLRFERGATRRFASHQSDVRAGRILRLLAQRQTEGNVA
jgi:hypothetical protein